MDNRPNTRPCRTLLRQGGGVPDTDDDRVIGPDVMHFPEEVDACRLRHLLAGHYKDPKNCLCWKHEKTTNTDTFMKQTLLYLII